ncbi:MAG: polysaccharide deacetylase family protein [Syntrophaceae bacterium]|nr:polysaccharide deacetylase family protein [Syntrophaceae bacterium]
MARSKSLLAKTRFFILSILIPLFLWQSAESSDLRIPILLYHRLGPVAADSMTLPTSAFHSHLRYFQSHGHRVIALRDLVDYLLGKKSPPPPGSLVITVDDAHCSVYTEMLPLVKKYNLPITLFVYPSAISNASYAMTWDQLREIKQIGLLDIQSHTLWHPNFKKEKKRLKPGEYEEFVERQLKRSMERLQKELGVKVEMLAWPFGIYDEWLISKAVQAGYVAGFTMERRHVTASDQIMALPRYLIVHQEKESPENMIRRLLQTR